MIYIFGCGGHAKVVTEVVLSQGDEVAGYIATDPGQREFLGRPVFAESRLPAVLTGSSVTIAVGDNLGRKAVFGRLQRAGRGFSYPSLIHRTASVSPSAQIAQGAVVMPGAIVNAASTVGAFCIVNSGSIVEHDCALGDFSMIAPGAVLCGSCHVGEGGWIGAGAVVVQHRHIGSWSVLGAGSVALHDVTDNCTATGVPATIRRSAGAATDG